MKTIQRKQSLVSAAVALLFIAVVLYYIVSPAYPGVFPIGIIAGICILMQMGMLFLSVKNIATNGFQLKTAAAIGIEVLSILGIGYFFIVWWLFI